MISGLKSLDKADRIKGLAALTAAANGTKPWPDFASELADLTGDDLKALVTAADAAAVLEPENAALRMAVAFAYAIWRDFLYGIGQGRFPYALGAHQALRGVYEGGRINIDATHK